MPPESAMSATTKYCSKSGQIYNFEIMVTIVNMIKNYNGDGRDLSHHGTPANDDLLMHLSR